MPFLTGLWIDVDLSRRRPSICRRVMLFDIGVYLVVVGTISVDRAGARRPGGRLMEAALSVLVGLFFAAGIYLLLSRTSSACCSASRSSATR